jgi:3-deoxy-D-manno-octulosonic-acid transferase
VNTLYTVLFYLAVPFILLRLWWRGRRSPGYRQKILERFGYYKSNSLKNTIWLHAVSYGEAVAAEPLVIALLERYPNRPLLVTTMTATGAARIAQRFAGQVIHQHVPYDLPAATERFFQHSQPAIAIIMETELWPNLLKTLARHKVPILLANARLSERSFRGYRKIYKLTEQMLRNITIIAAQSDADAARFQKLGALSPQINVVGNLKYDMTPRPDLWQAGLEWRKRLGERPVWMAASTHGGEEEQVLAAHKIILNKYPNALLILVPRHPERFDRVAQLCQSLHYSIERFSLNENPAENTQIFLVDTMGQLPKFYRAADVAFVGGSLVPIGGHNFIEAASAHAAIILGPHMHNFTANTEQFKQAHACEMIGNENELAEKVLGLLENPSQRHALIQAANALVLKNSGVLEKLMQHVAGLL